MNTAWEAGDNRDRFARNYRSGSLTEPDTYTEGLTRAIAGLFTLKLESEDSSLGLTRTGSSEVQDLVVVGHG